MWIILIIATLLCVVILVVRISESERVEEKKARIYNRDILSVTTIFQKFYSHTNFDEEELDRPSFLRKEDSAKIENIKPVEH